MTAKHKVIFYNFPNCSILLDEISLNNSIKSDIEFHTIESAFKTIEFISDNPDSFLIFYNEGPQDYIKAKNMLKQLKEEHKPGIQSIGIVSNLDGTVEKSLRGLGVKDIFTRENHSADIIEKMEFYLKEKSKKHHPFKDKKFTQYESNNILNLVIDKNDYRQEEFSQIIGNSIEAKKINLDTGDLNIVIAQDFGKPKSCSLDNFTEHEIEIVLEGESHYNMGDKLELNIIFQYNRCKVELLIEGLVESSEKTSESCSVVTLKLTNDERVSLQNFMSLYQQRQKSIDDFMELAKGY